MQPFLLSLTHMITDEDLSRFWATVEGEKLRKQFLDLEPALDRMVNAVRRSETLGDLGWAFPLDVRYGLRGSIFRSTYQLIVVPKSRFPQHQG